MSNTMVISFGCPRTGTTFMERLFSQANGVFYQKLREGDKLHPCQSDSGLVALAQLFRKKNLIFVRTKRNQRDIIDSFFAARLDGAKNKKGIGANSNERVVRFIVDEHNHTEQQKKTLAALNDFPFRLVECDYDQLTDPNYQKHFIREVLKHLNERQQLKNQHLLAYVQETFGKKPVREGKMRMGIKKQVAPESTMLEMLQEIERRVA